MAEKKAIRHSTIAVQLIWTKFGICLIAATGANHPHSL